MISTTIDDQMEAIIAVLVQGPDGGTLEVKAILDTGFNGYLTLPPHSISSLQLPWRCNDDGVLADGSTRRFDIYGGTVTWDGKARRIEIDSCDGTPLVGMSLMKGYELRMQVSPGGSVSLEALS